MEQVSGIDFNLSLYRMCGRVGNRRLTADRIIHQSCRLNDRSAFERAL